MIPLTPTTSLPTPFGTFQAYVYSDDAMEHLVLVMGNIENVQNLLVRVHSECLTGDVFGSKRCDCGSQLSLALEQIAAEGEGIFIYLRGQEGRGIGLRHKLQAYALQDKGLDTVEANLELGFPPDGREYKVSAQILTALGITTIRLMTNNPAKYEELEAHGLKVIERVPLITSPTPENSHYLKTKKEKLGHIFDTF
jgi:3,4-dihydroxy 2-butanone 4-phosphate synthase/GTP cyclohydrolase II